MHTELLLRARIPVHTELLLLLRARIPVHTELRLLLLLLRARIPVHTELLLRARIPVHTELLLLLLMPPLNTMQRRCGNGAAEGAASGVAVHRGDVPVHSIFADNCCSSRSSLWCR